MYRTSNQHCWRHSGWECACSADGFNPWSGKTSNATEQPNPCASTTDPVLESPGTTVAEARAFRACACNKGSDHNGKPAHRNQEEPCLPQQLMQSNEDPVQPETKTCLKRKRKRSLYLSFTDGQTLNISDKCELPRLRMKMTGTDRAVGIPGTWSK